MSLVSCDWDLGNLWVRCQSRLQARTLALQSAAFCFRQTAYCYCLLRTASAYCFLLTAYCFLLFRLLLTPGPGLDYSGDAGEGLGTGDEVVQLSH